MNRVGGKWWLAIVVMCCLAPAAFADRDRDRDRRCERDPRRGNCLAVPEGGSAAIYLIGAGLTCIGAMFLRSKVAEPAQS
jgi:hypothetical protein